MRDEPSRELATVTHLPARVLDAEIVTPEAWAELMSQRGQAMARRAAWRQDGVTVIRVTRNAVTHPHTVTAARAVGRHAWHVPAGARVIGKRLWEANSNSIHRRVMRGAEATGNWDRLELWEGKDEQRKQRRHQRVMDWISAPLELVKAMAVGFGTLIAGLVALGVVLAFGYHDPQWAFAPLRGFVTLIVTIAWVVTAVWGPLLLALPWVAVAVCWHVGRRDGGTPWCLAATGKRDGEPITPSKVVMAFRDLGIAELRKRIVEMDDAGGAMLSQIRPAGCGIEVDVTLPSGVATLDILTRRRRLAENLDRHEHEVHIAVAPQPRTVRVWAADSGMLDEPIGPSPLVMDEDSRADYRTGRAPWGVSLRGDPVTLSLYQRHLLIVGLSNQGKTASARALALWLALDPRVELRIADLKGDDDWSMFEGIATVLIEGPTDDHVVAAIEMLEAGVREMERRLTEGGTHTPLFLIIDESQQAVMCPAKDAAGRPYGGSKNNSRYFMAVRKIQNQGRAVDVLFWQGAQDPTNQNLPIILRNGAHLRISTVVGTEEQSEMALGAKAVDGGAAPHLLRQGLDKGTVVVAGDGAPLADGQASVTVRTHYIDSDAAQVIADRAKARRAPVRLRGDIEVVRDLLQDVHEALSEDDQLRAADMPARLRLLAPDHGPYRHLTGEDLVALLRAEGVEVRFLKGHLTIRADRVLRALDDRADEGE